MKHSTQRLVFPRASAAFLAIVVACTSAGCSSPAPEGTPQAPAASAAAAPAGAAPAAANPGAAPSAPEPAPAPPPPPPPPRKYTLAEGHAISVYTGSTLSTKTNQAGEEFTATLAEPITDGDWVVAKKGARVEGVIVDSDPGGRVKEVATITVSLKSLTLADGRTVQLATSHFMREAKSTKGKDAKKIGIGAGVGAAVGAIAGGGKGAAIGAGVGGAAGTGAVLATRGDPAVIPAETRVRVTLTTPVTITKGSGGS